MDPDVAIGANDAAYGDFTNLNIDHVVFLSANVIWVGFEQVTIDQFAILLIPCVQRDFTIVGIDLLNLSRNHVSFL